MIDVNVEDVISLVDATKDLPRRRAGKKPHVSCLYRWTQSGCLGVRLESIQIGGTRCTSREALARFFERLSAVEDDPPNLPSKSASLQKRAEAAERELDRMGV